MAKLLGFFADEFRAVALGELFNRFLALLYEGLQNLDGLGVVEGAYFFDFLVLDGGLDSAQDAEPQFILGAHSVDQVFLDFFGKTHLRFLTTLNIADGQMRREEWFAAWHESRLFDSARRARYFGLLVLCGENPRRRRGS